MNKEKDSLYAELTKLQNENVALYEQLSNLKKEKRKLQKSKEEEESENEFKAQIEALKAQQKQEEASRAAAKNQLQSVVKRMKSIQNEIDEQNALIQNRLNPQLKAEEELTDQYYRDLLKKCEKIPSANVEKMRKLISEFQKKSLEVFQSQEEIEKLTRLISINEPYGGGDDLSVPITEPDLQFNENPLPCFAQLPQSLDAARTKRRVSFKINLS